jgi:transposase
MPIDFPHFVTNKSRPNPRGGSMSARTSIRPPASDDQTTEEFKQRYAARSGIEGTHAQAISRCGLRRCRYIGLVKTRLQHVITAAAVNLIRIADWYGDNPLAATRRSRFADLQMAA